MTARTDVSVHAQEPPARGARTTAAEGATDGWWGFAAVILFASFALVTAGGATVFGHPEALLALLAVPAAIAGRSRPWRFALALIAGGLWLRIVFALYGEVTDQLIVSRAALDLVLSGGVPYGVGYAESIPPGAPFPYGPLAMLTSPAWIWGEIAFAGATMALVAWTRSWLTLAAYASYWTIVDLSTAGLNDVAPGFFITAALLALRSRPWLGALLIAVAAGLKPYAGAWFPGVVGVGGLTGLAVLAAASAAVWLPAVVAWGPGAIIRSFEMARAVHTVSENALNVPALRILAAPVAIVALFLRSWWMAAVSGLAIFSIVLFLDSWASLGYLIAIAPITGILVEMGIRHVRDRRRPTASAEAAAVA